MEHKDFSYREVNWQNIQHLTSCINPHDLCLCVLIHSKLYGPCKYYTAYVHFDIISKWTLDDKDYVIIVLPLGIIDKIKQIQDMFDIQTQRVLCLQTVLINKYIPPYHNLQTHIHHIQYNSENIIYNRIKNVLQLSSKIDLCKYFYYIYNGKHYNKQNPHCRDSTNGILSDEIINAANQKRYGSTFKLHVCHLVCSIILNSIVHDTDCTVVNYLSSKHLWYMFVPNNPQLIITNTNTNRDNVDSKDIQQASYNIDGIYSTMHKQRFELKSHALPVYMYLIQHLTIPKCGIDNTDNASLTVLAKYTNKHSDIERLKLQIVRYHFKKKNKSLVYYCNTCRYPYWMGERVLSKKKKYSNKIHRPQSKKCASDTTSTVQQEDNANSLNRDLLTSFSRKKKHKHMSYMAETMRMKCINGCENLSGPIMQHQNLVDFYGNSYSVIATNSTNTISVCQMCRGCRVVIKNNIHQQKYCIECKLVKTELDKNHSSNNDMSMYIFYSFIYNTCLMYHSNESPMCNGCKIFLKVYSDQFM